MPLGSGCWAEKATNRPSPLRYSSVMTVKRSFTLPYSPLGMDQCASSARCEGFKSNSEFINERAIGWGRRQGVTFLFHPFHVHQLLHVVGVVQPQLHPDKGLPPLQTELVPGLWASQEVGDGALGEP